MIVTSEEFARQRGLEVLATIVSQGYVADDFAYLARTPAKAGAIALDKAGKTIDDVERVELNEAFCSVVLNSAKMLGAHEETVNVNGGAVALGHPSAPRARGSSGRWCTTCAATAVGSASRRSAPAAARATPFSSRFEALALGLTRKGELSPVPNRTGFFRSYCEQ